MRLRPSDICYSQCSISNTFTDGDMIGEVLDDICDGRLRKRNFPLIEVVKLGKYWYTGDNRRLWVFRQLEALGRCGRIPVVVVYGIPPHKMTTKNGGVEIKVRGNPGGKWIKHLECTCTCSTDASSDEELYARFEDFGF